MAVVLHHGLLLTGALGLVAVVLIDSVGVSLIERFWYRS